MSENILILKSSHKAPALSFDTALFESLTNKIQQIISSIILCYIIDRMRLHHLNIYIYINIKNVGGGNLPKVENSNYPSVKQSHE